MATGEHHSPLSFLFRLDLFAESASVHALVANPRPHSFEQ